MHGFIFGGIRKDLGFSDKVYMFLDRWVRGYKDLSTILLIRETDPNNHFQMGTQFLGSLSIRRSIWDQKLISYINL